jgi:hypothetical protein
VYRTPFLLKLVAGVGVGLFVLGVIVAIVHGPYVGGLIYPGIVLCVIAALSDALLRRRKH